MEWPLPEALPSDFEQWVSRIAVGPDEAGARNIAMARDLTRLMEASNLSARTAQAVKL